MKNVFAMVLQLNPLSTIKSENRDNDGATKGSLLVTGILPFGSVYKPEAAVSRDLIALPLVSWLDLLSGERQLTLNSEIIESI